MSGERVPQSWKRVTTPAWTEGHTAMEKHPRHELLHPINIHRVRRSQEGGTNEGDDLDDSKTGRAFPLKMVGPNK